MFILNPYRFVTAGVSEDPVATAWFDKHAVAPSVAFRGSVNKLLAGLRADGDLKWFTRLMLPAETLQALNVDVIQPTKGTTVVGGVAFLPKGGIQCDNQVSYLDMGENTALPANGGGAGNNILQGVYTTQPLTTAVATHVQGLIGQLPASYRHGLRSGQASYDFRTNGASNTPVDRVNGATGLRQGLILHGRSNSTTKFGIDFDGTMVEPPDTLSGVSTTNTAIGRAGNWGSNVPIAIAFHGLAIADGHTFALANRNAMLARFNTFLREIGAIP